MDSIDPDNRAASGEESTAVEPGTRPAFCTACGAVLVDGRCSAACQAVEPWWSSLDVAAVPVEPDVPEVRDVPTAPGTGSPRGRAWIWSTAALALVLLAAAVVGGAGYHRLSARLTGLQAAVDANRTSVTETQRAQRAANDVLRDRQDGQADQLTAVQNQLSEHPAAAKIAKDAGRSVYTVLTDYGLGSGFVIGDDNGASEVLTNFHVVREAYVSGTRTVEVRRGGDRLSGSIVDVSEANDLALIRVDATLPALQFASGRAAVGDPVLVLGSPNGLAGTVTSGIVSAYRKLQAVEYLQFSAPISPGNSGGPILDEHGRVLGVTVMKEVSDGSEGLAFGIPASRVCDSFDLC